MTQKSVFIHVVSLSCSSECLCRNEESWYTRRRRSAWQLTQYSHDAQWKTWIFEQIKKISARTRYIMTFVRRHLLCSSECCNQGSLCPASFRYSAVDSQRSCPSCCRTSGIERASDRQPRCYSDHSDLMNIEQQNDDQKFTNIETIINYWSLGRYQWVSEYLILRIQIKSKMFYCLITEKTCQL